MFCNDKTELISQNPSVMQNKLILEFLRSFIIN